MAGQRMMLLRQDNFTIAEEVNDLDALKTDRSEHKKDVSTSHTDLVSLNDEIIPNTNNRLAINNPVQLITLSSASTDTVYMDKTRLIDKETSSLNYMNGGILMNILSTSDDGRADESLLNVPTNPHVQRNGKSPALQSTHNSSLHTSPTIQRNTLTASSGALRHRSAFANNRSASHDVPRNQSNTSNSLTRPCSHSGLLTQIGSFDRGTQTVRTSSGRLEREPKYESTISDIGVEYMKATGAIGIKFKQLQKPIDSSHESVQSSSIIKLLNSENTESTQKTDNHRRSPSPPKSTVVNLYNDSAHMTKQETQSSPHKHDDNPYHHIGYRLGRRKLLAERRRKIADLCCAFALLGLLLMIIETECSIAKLYNKYSTYSFVTKSLISLSTVILLILISVYHMVEIQLFVVDNCIEDWRIAMSWQRVSQIIIELLICTVHPPAVTYFFNWTILDIKTLQYRTEQVPVDIILSLPMFLRLYIIVRVMLLHSKLFTDASSRSIGALNKITFNARFVLKTLMTIFPGTVLGVFMMSIWIICAWTLRACENYHNDLLSNFLTSLYMVAITFLSVGYGDFVPHTYCGRFIAVCSGLMGAGCTALVVAVIAKKLELTRAEKHVHNFMLETQLSKKLKDAAANVLRETWLIYKYTKLVRRVNGRKVRSHQRKFLKAIQELRLVKLKQRKLTDQANSLTDFAKTASQVHDIVSDLKCNQTASDDRIEKIEQSLQNLQYQMENLPSAIAQIVLEKQLSNASFVSASDMSHLNSPVQHRTRQGNITTQSSFDSCQ